MTAATTAGTFFKPKNETALRAAIQTCMSQPPPHALPNLSSHDAAVTQAVVEREGKMSTGRFVVLRNFLSAPELLAIVRSMPPTPPGSEAKLLSSSSVSLDLGLQYTGAPLNNPIVTELAARAFVAAGEALAADGRDEMAREVAEPSTEQLTGIALLYGPAARMTAHYDSPTQPGRRREWLAMLTAGNAVRFRLGNSTEVLRSGDALVMDAMATLHGVEAILPPRSRDDDDLGAGMMVDPAEHLGLPAGSRLGVLLWTAAPDPRAKGIAGDGAVDGIDDDEGDRGGVLGGLFLEEDDDSQP